MLAPFSVRVYKKQNMESFDKMTKKQLIEFLKKCRQPTFGNKSGLVRKARERRNWDWISTTIGLATI